MALPQTRFIDGTIRGALGGMQQNGSHPSLAPARIYPAPRPRVRPSQRQTSAAAQRDAQAAAAPQRRPRGRFFFALAGFGLGVAFWHAVGFWDFVSTVVYKPDRYVRAPIEIQIGAGESATASFAAPLRATPPVAGCSSLVLSRESSGEVRVLPCPVNAPELRDGNGATRGDLQPVRSASGPHVPAVATWSATITEQGAAKPR